MRHKKLFLLPLIFLLMSCSSEVVERASLPSDELLVIAHRGASAYLPEHTIPAYELAVEMGADYVELDLHMTQDKKLVALHDSEVHLNGEKQAIAKLTLNDLREFSPGVVFNELHPELAKPTYESFAVPELSEILAYFEADVNYYIEIKSPTATPGMEKELINTLQEHQLLNRSDPFPKVIIQSFSTESLKKVFELDPSIPLIKLYGQNTKQISNKEMDHLLTYASGIGVNKYLLSRDLVNQLHKNNLHIHPFVLNEKADIQNAIEIGVDGLFTDKPDIAIKIRDIFKANQ